MLLLVDIKKKDAQRLIAAIRSSSSAKVGYASAADVELLTEIKEIKAALKYAHKVKLGKLKSRPAIELLREI